MYFDRYTVRALFCDLARRFHRSEVVFDVQNSWMVKNSDRHEALKHVRARFVFGCDDDLEFERWADNLHLMSVKRLTVDFPQWKRLLVIPYRAADPSLPGLHPYAALPVGLTGTGRSGNSC